MIAFGGMLNFLERVSTSASVLLICISVGYVLFLSATRRIIMAFLFLPTDDVPGHCLSHLIDFWICPSIPPEPLQMTKWQSMFPGPGRPSMAANCFMLPAEVPE